MSKSDAVEVNLACPPRLPPTGQVSLADGGGGAAAERFLEKLIRSRFSDPRLVRAHDGALLAGLPGPLAFSADSYVVRPWSFPGGNIGDLAVNGTVNDLAMCGARPTVLSLSLILEEGFAYADLAQILDAVQCAARAAGVAVVTGDTKVVERGHGDGVYINTSGIGTVVADQAIGPDAVRPGDCILLSGDIGRHGMAVMAMRDQLEFEPPISSDTMNVAPAVLALLDAGLAVHCLRDPTRGGLAAVLNEIAAAARVQIRLQEEHIPVCASVRGACELLGLDPLHIASEGRFVVFVPEQEADAALNVLRQQHGGEQACVIGSVSGDHAAPGVIAQTALGSWRCVDRPEGDLLPRIC